MKMVTWPEFCLEFISQEMNNILQQMRIMKYSSHLVHAPCSKKIRSCRPAWSVRWKQLWQRVQVAVLAELHRSHTSIHHVPNYQYYSVKSAFCFSEVLIMPMLGSFWKWWHPCSEIYSAFCTQEGIKRAWLLGLVVPGHVWVPVRLPPTVQARNQ